MADDTVPKEHNQIRRRKESKVKPYVDDFAMLTEGIIDRSAGVNGACVLCVEESFGQEASV